MGMLAVACGGEDECRNVAVTSDQSCGTTQDCIDEGFQNFSCIDGICRLPCLTDADCAPPEDDDGCPVDEGFSAAVCDNQVCTVGCPVQACPAGQDVCQRGRCAYFFDGFESRDDTTPTFESLGWNGLDRELSNNRSEIRLSGAPGCNPGPACAGPAASGERFALLAAVPAPEKGTPNTGPSCRACACCLECRLDPPLQSVDVLECPRELAIPPRLYCGPAVSCGEPLPDDSIPEACSGVCDLCGDCVDDPLERTGELLTSCEQEAATKGCPACIACRASEASCLSCRASQCEAECEDRLSEGCRQCETDNGCDCADCRTCTVCTDAETCAVGGGSAAECLALEQACDALGVDGCYPVPLGYPRTELTDGEQALESPAIDLSSASGDVVLEFTYVPFNVGVDYTRPEQGVSACDWQTRAQQIRIQLCGGSCAAPDSWVDAATLPPPSQRGNGLSLASQSGVDWRTGQVRVPIPNDLRTSEFRFRFLPELSESARLGIDDVFVRVR